MGKILYNNNNLLVTNGYSSNNSKISELIYKSELWIDDNVIIKNFSKHTEFEKGKKYSNQLLYRKFGLDIFIEKSFIKDGEIKSINDYSEYDFVLYLLQIIINNKNDNFNIAENVLKLIYEFNYKIKGFDSEKYDFIIKSFNELAKFKEKNKRK